MRKCNVVTICLPELYDTEPEKNMERAVEILDSVEGLKPDLVCLPECFLEICVNHAVDHNALREMFHAALSAKARTLHSYVVAGLREFIGDKFYNTAWLFDREGNVAGKYLKYFPTDREVGNGTIPGPEIPVFETDFGKLGILICFDIDWPRVWTEIGEKGAEVVAWISAYEGGYPLFAYAASNSYYVVSSVRANRARIIDKSGKVLASSSKWAHWAYQRIDLDQTMFHIDNQFDKLTRIQRELGDKITLETFDEAGRFTLESNDPDWPMERIIRAYGLETFRAYHDRVERLCDQSRSPKL